MSRGSGVVEAVDRFGGGMTFGTSSFFGSSRGGFATGSALVLVGAMAGLVLVVAFHDGPAGARSSSVPVPVTRASTPADFDVQAMLNKYCVVCHNKMMQTANLGFDTLNAAEPSTHPETWEKVINKLRTGTMPPAGMPRPDSASYVAAAEQLENQLDAAWRAQPNPGRINAIHRLNRTEYNNAVRDLLAV